MLGKVHGFTLIELMIVLAVIALLAAIAIPVYGDYRVRAAENACMAETKNYANLAVAALQTQGSVTVPPPPRAACAAADDAVALATPITGTPHPPGVRVTTCDMRSASCSITP